MHYHLVMKARISENRGLKEVESLSSLDYMDDGSVIKLKITIDRRDGSAVFDFSGTGYEVHGNCNAPRAVTLSGLIYCLRSMVGHDIPLNQVSHVLIKQFFDF